MLTQAQADRLIEMLKHSVREDTFNWAVNRRQDEGFISVEEERIQFILHLKRNPFEIRLHFKTASRDIGLARVDSTPYHTNPDGTELRNTPHLHLYREGDDLAYAEPAPWYDVSDPLGTLQKFLEVVHARFRGPIQLEIV